MTSRPPVGAGESAPSAPDFDPVPVRSRRDGWTAERQRVFIATLRAGHSVSKAALAAGMSRESAYRLRARAGAESFAAAWDAALAARPPAGPSAASLLWHRAIHGMALPIYRGGERVGTLVRPDDRALLKLHDRFERAGRALDRHRARRRPEGHNENLPPNR